MYCLFIDAGFIKHSVNVFDEYTGSGKEEWVR